MSAIARLGDVASGHHSFPKTNTIQGSPTCDVNGLPAHCVSHDIAPHSSPSPSPIHSRNLGSGSSTCDVDGLPLGSIGSSVDCGGLIMTGSSDSFID